MQQHYLRMGQLTLEPCLLTPSLLWNLPALNSCKLCFPCYHIPGLLVFHFPWVIGHLIFHYHEFNGFKIQSRSDKLSVHKVQNITFSGQSSRNAVWTEKSETPTADFLIDYVKMRKQTKWQLRNITRHLSLKILTIIPVFCKSEAILQLKEKY